MRTVKGVAGELILKTTNKGTFCEATKRLLRKEALVFSLKLTCSLVIQDLNRLTENTEVDLESKATNALMQSFEAKNSLW